MICNNGTRAGKACLFGSLNRILTVHLKPLLGSVSTLSGWKFLGELLGSVLFTSYYHLYREEGWAGG